MVATQSNGAGSPRDDLGAAPWSGPGPVAHPVFKTGGARHSALEGSTPSPFRMGDRDALRAPRAVSP
jgi:hypothetical protein